MIWMTGAPVLRKIRRGLLSPVARCPGESFKMKIKSFFKYILKGVFFVGLCHAYGAGWVGTWGTSPQLTEPRNLPPPPGLSGNTLRQIVQVSIGGEKLRVLFSNHFGINPVGMFYVHLAFTHGGSAIKTSHDPALKSQGQPDVTIPAGETVLSDAFDFHFAPLSKLA